MTRAQLVRDAMLLHPTVHPADLTVTEARSAFARSPRTHLLLLVAVGRLISTVSRGDLEIDADLSAPAAQFGALLNRTVDPDAPLAATHDGMVCQGQRRLAVVDSSMRLLGLLCLNRNLAGFCTDEAVAAMRRARQRSPGQPAGAPAVISSAS